MHLDVNPCIVLTEFRPSDRSACVARINDPEIYAHTLRIPHPYSASHFDEWMEIVAQATHRHGEPIHFAIREKGLLIGGIGFDGLSKGHRAEIGYWLARPWWGRGIMTEVVRRACACALAEWRLVRITAHVFAFNAASARVLEKNGFVCEGRLRKHCLKDGQFLDSLLFALVR